MDVVHRLGGMVFFDSKAITSKLDPAIKKALSRFGAITRQDAKKSLKYGDKPARAGQPPTVHRSRGFTRTKKSKGIAKQQPSSPLRELTFFAFNPTTESVVVGPAADSRSRGAIPAAIEEGGTSTAVIDGTRKVIRLAPHPWMGPAFEKQRPKSAELFAGLIR
jgi:hypothetical protein